MGVLSNFDIDNNFWDTEPVFKTVEPFKSTYLGDKSKGKKQSSTLMWCVALFADATQENRLGRATEKDRLDIIETDYLGGEFDVNGKYKFHIKMYTKLAHTQLERTMINFEAKLAERDKFIMATKYTVENGKELDVLLANTDKLYRFYKSILEDIRKEKSAAGTTKGDKIESVSETRMI